MASHGQPSRKQPSGPLLRHFLQPMHRMGSIAIRPNGVASSSATQNMQSSTGQYSTQAGEPAHPVQHSVMTANSFGFFFRGVVKPLDLGSDFISSGTMPTALVAPGAGGMAGIIACFIDFQPSSRSLSCAILGAMFDEGPTAAPGIPAQLPHGGGDLCRLFRNMPSRSRGGVVSLAHSAPPQTGDCISRSNHRRCALWVVPSKCEVCLSSSQSNTNDCSDHRGAGTAIRGRRPSIAVQRHPEGSALSPAWRGIFQALIFGPYEIPRSPTRHGSAQDDST